VDVLRESFADWKSPGPFVRIGEDYREVAAREETLQTPDKANAVYLAGFGFAMRDDDPEYPAIAIGGHMIGGGSSIPASPPAFGKRKALATVLAVGSVPARLIATRHSTPR
jgi:hypothetical protein